VIEPGNQLRVAGVALEGLCSEGRSDALVQQGLNMKAAGQLLQLSTA